MSTSRRTVLATGALGALGGLAAAALSPAAELVARADPSRRPGDHGPDRPLDPRRPKHQLRGLWIATVANLNWPSKPGLSVAQQQSELIAWFDLAVEGRYNAVFLQVRSAAQVFYASPLEPWSAYLTGTQGQDPGYDPLAFAVREAHARGLELHAWFNPYQLVRANATHAQAPTHPSVLHPEWSVTYAGTQYFNPGLPEVRRWVQDAIMVAVEHYDLDAVHFDDFFYPYPVEGQVFDDADAYARHGDGRSLDDWRRHNVDLLISELGVRIKKAKPWVKWGISPFAVWRNVGTDPAGSATTATQSYDAIYADTRRWVQEEWIDYIAPQVYWTQDFAVAPYDTVVDWWCEQVRGRDVALYIGEATYKIGLSPTQPAWQQIDEMSNHLAHDATRPEVDGNVYFSIPYVRDDELGATTLVEQTWYSRPALIPPMPWIDRCAPRAVEHLVVDRRGGTTTLAFRADDRDAVRFAVYRLPRTRDRIHPRDPRLADATYLHAVLPATGSRTRHWADPVASDQPWTYVVTALDRLWNESAPRQASTR